MSSAAAREQVRVARRLGELPAIRAAFGRGELSYSKVRALSRVASRELEGELLELARYATASQLERVLRAYRGVIARERTGLDNAHGERYLRLDCDDDGSVVIRGRLPAEEGALVAVALAAARDGLRDGRSNFEPRGRGAEGEPSTLGRGVSAEKSTAADASSPAAVYERAPVSNADGLVLMAETLLSAGAAELGGGERYQVVVHVDVGALAGAAADGEQRAGACQLENGELLHPETARRLACDASLVRILERDGRPLSVGRRSRSVPPALNRALRSRDRGCCFPGCPQRRFLHAHHIDHWARGGRTELANLVRLCGYHHRLLHEGGYTLERSAHGQLRFRRPDGRPIEPVPAPRPGDGDQLERHHQLHGPPIEPNTCVSLSEGDRLDLALNVDRLLYPNPQLTRRALAQEPDPPFARAGPEP